jgi:hypothetical protein
MTDADTPDDKSARYAELWDRVGRRSAADALGNARYDVDEAMEMLTVETMFQGEDPSPEDIRAARLALNTARRVLEEFVAPAAGCEEWGDPIPEMPYGRYREIAGCDGEGAQNEE